MGQFTGQVKLDYRGEAAYTYRPGDDPLTYTADDGRVYCVAEELQTDLASVPRVLWVLPGYAKDSYGQSALVHDWLYELHHRGAELLNFRASNALLEEMVRSEGGHRFRAWSYRIACDLAGWPFWNGRLFAKLKVPAAASRLSPLALQVATDYMERGAWEQFNGRLERMNFTLMSLEAVETWLTVAQHPDAKRNLPALPDTLRRCRIELTQFRPDLSLGWLEALGA